jgi:hypothetical protein
VVDAGNFAIKRLVALSKMVVASLVKPRSDFEWVIERKWVRGASFAGFAAACRRLVQRICRGWPCAIGEGGRLARSSLGFLAFGRQDNQKAGSGQEHGIGRPRQQRAFCRHENDDEHLEHPAGGRARPRGPRLA